MLGLKYRQNNNSDTSIIIPVILTFSSNIEHYFHTKYFQKATSITSVLSPLLEMPVGLAKDPAPGRGEVGHEEGTIGCGGVTRQQLVGGKKRCF